MTLSANQLPTYVKRKAREAQNARPRFFFSGKVDEDGSKPICDEAQNACAGAQIKKNTNAQKNFGLSSNHPANQV